MNTKIEQLNKLLQEDESVTYDYNDTFILLEEESEIVPVDLKEKVLNGEYIL